MMLISAATIRRTGRDLLRQAPPGIERNHMGWPTATVLIVLILALALRIRIEWTSGKKKDSDGTNNSK